MVACSRRNSSTTPSANTEMPSSHNDKADISDCARWKHRAQLSAPARPRFIHIPERNNERLILAGRASFLGICCQPWSRNGNHIKRQYQHARCARVSPIMTEWFGILSIQHVAQCRVNSCCWSRSDAARKPPDIRLSLYLSPSRIALRKDILRCPLVEMKLWG